MKEIIDSLTHTISTRLRSRLYGAFTLWWLVFHWGFFYSIFFLDQNIILHKTGLLKDQYLKVNYLNTSYGYFWFELLMPFLMTYITVIWLPKLVLIVYKIEKDDDYDKQVVEAGFDKKVEALRATTEETKISTLEVVKERVEKEKDIEDIETSIWSKEYNKFKVSRLYPDFDEIIESLYEHGGLVKQGFNDGSYEFEVETDILVYSHTNDLVSYDKRANRIEITDKGKYFIKRYKEDNI